MEPPGFYGPNVWPNLPEEDFRDPIWEYYQGTTVLGRIIWAILLQGLGYSADLLDVFAKRPIVQMKMIRYPPSSLTKEGQFGVGAHTDFGGVTVLLTVGDFQKVRYVPSAKPYMFVVEFSNRIIGHPNTKPPHYGFAVLGRCRKRN